MLSQVLRPIVRNMTRATGTRFASSETIPEDFKRPTINDMLQPHGSWQEHYDKRQKIYNTKLIIGIVYLVSTLIFVKKSEIIFFNWGPPEQPIEEKN